MILAAQIAQNGGGLQILEAALLFLAMNFSCLDDVSNLSLTGIFFDLQAFVRFGLPDVSMTLVT